MWKIPLQVLYVEAKYFPPYITIAIKTLLMSNDQESIDSVSIEYGLSDFNSVVRVGRKCVGQLI